MAKRPPLAPSRLVDREHERARFRELMHQGAPRLVLIYGRRRVGKTFLLNRVWPDTPSFYFTAAETTPEQNRVALLQAFAEWRGAPINVDDYPTWRTVFRLLIEHEVPKPLAITIDEFQYLGEDERGMQRVASELNAVWETPRPDRALVFTLSGSAVRTIERLESGGAPLYGRFAWQHRLDPFDYWNAAELAGCSALRDRAIAYGVFGGTPRYLAAIDRGRSLVENIQSLMLAPDGEVREMVRTALLQEQGLRDVPKYVAILRAVAGGRVAISAIAQATGLDLDTTLRAKVQRLIALGYLHAERNDEAKSREPFAYRIADPAVRFYYDFVAPLESVLSTQRASIVWNRHIAPRLDSHMGHVFEQIVEQAYYRQALAAGLPLVKSWGRWEGRDRDRRSVEIDIVARCVEGAAVLTGAIKWNRKPLGPAVFTEHLDALRRLADAGVAWAHGALAERAPMLFVAAGGFSSAFERQAKGANVRLWTLDDLYGRVELIGASDLR